MPSAKSARVEERNRRENMPYSGRAKTFIAKARAHISRNELDLAEEAVKDAVVALDKAALRGVIHPNNAARRKSRLMKQLHLAKSR